MSVIRIHKHLHTFVMLDTTCLNDTRLSYRARGLHAYLVSKPDDWSISILQLEKFSAREGREAVRTALNELITYGYAKRVLRRNRLGKLEGYETVIYETPCADIPETRLADIGSTDVGSSPPTQDCSSQGLKKEKNSLPTGESKKGARRCPMEYVPPAHLRQWAAEKYPAVPFDESCDAMRDYEFARTRTDWDATLRNWIRNEAKRAPRSPRPSLPDKEYRTLANAYTLMQEDVADDPRGQTRFLPGAR